MILHQGMYLPDGETHLTDWMTRNGELVDGRGTYQIKKLRAALTYCTTLRSAVDVGANVGLWSVQLAKRFARVYSFEPLQAHIDCFSKNFGGMDASHVELFGCALGERAELLPMATKIASCGDSSIAQAADGLPILELVNGEHQQYKNIPVKTMDSFDLLEVDFIKLDCEGFELFALRGGEKTILRDRPVIIVEQKPGKAQKYGLPETGAVTWLEELGYSVARVMSGDFIMTWSQA